MHFLNLDAWLFFHCPDILFASGFILGWKRWTKLESVMSVVSMSFLLLIRYLTLKTNIFLGESFYSFLALYLVCFWILIVNLKYPGLMIFALGGLMNAFAALINGGKMPVFGYYADSSFHQSMNYATKLWWLCDWIETPGGLYIGSPGDFFLIIGPLVFFLGELKFFLNTKNSN